MYIPPRVRKLLWLLPVAVVLVAPGWGGVLETVAHSELLARVRGSGIKTSVSLPGEREGETWHATYLDDGPADFVRWLRMREFLPSLLPPDFVAHIPPGAVRADGYYRVKWGGRWPWWWPGGGMDWTEPEDPFR